MANKTLAARVVLTCGQPMVVIENPNPSQIEREKSAWAKEKTARGQGTELPGVTQASCRAVSCLTHIA
jgi:hypothetical protein